MKLRHILFVTLIIVVLISALLWLFVAWPQGTPYSDTATGVMYVKARKSNNADRMIVFKLANGNDRWVSFKPINIRLQPQGETNWQKMVLNNQRLVKVAPHHAQIFTLTAPEGDVHWSATFECRDCQPRSLNDLWRIFQNKPKNEEGNFNAFLGTPDMVGLNPQH